MSKAIHHTKNNVENLPTPRIRQWMSLLALLLLVFGAAEGVWGQTNYVLYNGTYGYVYNNNNSLGASATFSPSAVWVASGTLGTTNRTIYSYTANTRYMIGSNGYFDNGATVTLGTTQSDVWQMRDDLLATYNTYGRTFYLNYNGSVFTIRRNDFNQLFTPYEVTITSVSVGLTDFTIEGDDYIKTTTAYTHTNTSYLQNQTKYEFNDQTYYSADGSTAQTTPYVTEVTSGYTWTLTGGGDYASVNASTGEITVNSTPANDLEMTLTCSVTYSGQTKTASKTVTLSYATVTTGQYAIYSGAYYLGGSGTNAISTFNPSTCLWTGTDGGTWQSMEGNYINIYNGSLYVDDDAQNLNLTGTESGNTGQKLDYNSYYYLRYNNGWTVTRNSGNSGTNVVFAVTQRSYEAHGTAPTISGADIIATTTTSDYNVGTAAAYQVAYIDYIFYNGTHHYCLTNTSDATSTQPAASTFTYSWSLSDNADGHATVDASNGEVTYSTYYGRDTEVTLTLTATSTEHTYTVSKTITLKGSTVDPTNITANDLTVYVDSTKTLTVTLTPSPCYTNLVFTSADETKATVDADGVVTGVAIGSTTVNIKAYKYSDPTAYVETTATITVKDKVATPVITIDQSTGSTTITCATDGATIYYTTDGSTPTTSSTSYSSAFTVTSGTTVKAIAVKTGYDNSEIASELYIITGISDGVVFFNDLEDHTWTYYAGVDASVDGGNYSNYAGKIYSPNPRNVKITYNGVNGISGSSTTVRVSIDETENSFVYYKTLEQGNTEGKYPYQVISNPFSVRPSTGSGNNKTYYGFAGWKIVSGGEYIQSYDNNDILPLDAEIVFEDLPYPSVNCTSAEIVFETSWTQATVRTGDNIASMLNNFSGGTYETNFAVLTGSYTTAWTGNKNATITSVYPDGSEDVSDDVYTRLNLTLNDGYTIKYEHIHINNSNSTFSMGSGTKTLYIGRGVSNTDANGVCCNLIQGYNNTIYNGGLTYTLKIESGIYNYLSFAKGYEGAGTNNTVSGTIAIQSILGSDYDRANGTNDNLKIQQQIIFGYGTNSNTALLQSPSAGDEVLDVTFKSGSLNSSLTSAGTADAQYSFYIGIGNSYCRGYRKFTMEGGEMWSLAAGLCNNTATTNSIRFRIKGGLIKGSIYGSAANADSYGYKQMILTGGQVKGWIAGGGNGTSDNGGTTTGSSYIYVGGNCQVDSEGSTTYINSSLGGQVFGSGSGVQNTTTWGEMLYGTNVVIADNAYIERNVFGGGNFGWTDEDATIYLTGESMSVGNVYGGANQNKGDNVKIYMTGGTVREGLYGGSNTTGTINYDVEMHINGGQVGTSSATANIHGGGYGQSTRVSGNVEITLGENGQTEDGVVVYGDVYGGSALGYVNGTTADTTYHTYVTLNKGTINGSLYGGGLGSDDVEANVYGPVAVKVYGGSVKQTSASGSGGVYGANNINGAPQRAVTVDIYGTDPAPAEDEYALYAVYGGGNQADYIYDNGYPAVTVHNCDNSIEYVYGGGNAAAVKTTDVIIYGGNVIGNAFGGGNGTDLPANVTHGANLKIYGGTILNAYGGSNSQGTIGGAISITVNSQADTDSEGSSTPCTMNVGNVYGGGNMADSNAGSISIGCTGTNGHIDAVYGGANQANITGDIDLYINGGDIGNVFGGNNASGSISGSITVTVGNDPLSCDIFEIGNVYGGGNLADYGTAGAEYPAVNICSGTITNNVYGGGLGTKAVVTGNPKVTIGDATKSHQVTIGGDVYGGGDAAAVKGTPIVHLTNKCNTSIANVYGGGNAANVNGTAVTIDGGTVTGMVFGGGNGYGEGNPGANVNGDVEVNIHGGTLNKVFGGSNSKGDISGSVTVSIAKEDNACDLNITEVYGGGNQADGKAGTINIGCTGASTEGIGDVYGGAYAADINSDITLNITGGTIGRVFGGNNASGEIDGDIVVNINWNGTSCEANSLGNVYGAGNEAAYTGTPTVNILNGTVTGSVYGGGLGSTAVVTGTTEVNINGSGATVTQNVYGGGDAASVTGSTIVNVLNGAVGGSVFGGGYGAATEVTGNVTVSMGAVSEGAATGAAIVTGDVYGGSALGEVNTSTSNTTSVNIISGTVNGSVYGGGLGDATNEALVKGNVEVNVGADNSGTYLGNATITGNVFGCNNVNGTPLGNVEVNIYATNHTEGNTINDSGFALEAVYGGGNKADYVPTAEKAKSTVTIHGCYNTINYVYGGGNAAAVPEANSTIEGGHIGWAFAGGNGYSATGNHTDPYQPNYNPGANVGLRTDGSSYTNASGNATATLYGGTIDHTFAGSNQYGTITGTTTVALDNSGSGCEMALNEVFGGGNEADITSDVNTVIDCNESMNDIWIPALYGGCNMADITGNVNLTVYGGSYLNVYGGSKGTTTTPANIQDDGTGTKGNVTVNMYGGRVGNATTEGNIFGGSNINGNIEGQITVNVEYKGDGDCPFDLSHANVYGGGNLAQYDKTPEVNIINGTVLNVFGGGNGDPDDDTQEPGQVQGSKVNIGVDDDQSEDYRAVVLGNVYGGGNAARVTANTLVNIKKHAKVFGNIYGGGNMGKVGGNTKVVVNGQNQTQLNDE